MAVDNPRWGYTWIRGALSNLGHTIARTTVKRILHDHGVDPAPERSRHMPWKTFLQAHWEGLAACDLFTVEVLTLAGLRRYPVFFVIELRSRHPLHTSSFSAGQMQKTDTPAARDSSREEASTEPRGGNRYCAKAGSEQIWTNSPPPSDL